MAKHSSYRGWDTHAKTATNRYEKQMTGVAIVGKHTKCDVLTGYGLNSIIQTWICDEQKTEDSIFQTNISDCTVTSHSEQA
jgi:hypothetical protein